VRHHQRLQLSRVGRASSDAPDDRPGHPTVTHVPGRGRAFRGRRLPGRGASLAACILFAACSGKAEPEIARSTTAAETTIPITEVIELTGMTIHVDPAVMALPQTAAVVGRFPDLMEAFPLRDAVDVMLYGTSGVSIDWIDDKTRELDCLIQEDREFFLGGGWAAPCGLIMRVDALPAGCSGQAGPCIDALTVAAHEYFHIVTDELLERCVCEPMIYGNKIPNWYAEGIADYVALQSVFGSDPDWMTKALDNRKARATEPVVSVGLEELEELWSGGPSQEWFGLLYDRSFLAVAFLVERNGEAVVLERFFDELAGAGWFQPGFEATFGATVRDIESEFLEWVAAL
jgi:hypothetical protein